MRHSIYILDEVDSTNEYLKRTPLPEWSAVLARRQTAGKGRLGRSFESAEGLGMYLSVVLPADGSLAWLTPAAAVAARRVVAALGAECGIKWVNDIIAERPDGWRKLCGILVELRDRRAILGIGIDLCQREEDFPAELRDVCTSVALEGGRAASPEETAEMFLCELETLVSDENTVFSEYKRCCVTPGKDILVKRLPQDAGVPARALRLARDYSLEVEYEDGRTERLRAGEASIRPRER